MSSYERVTLCKKGENKMKDYDLLKEGDDWTVLSYNPFLGAYQRMVTFYWESWEDNTKSKAEEYIAIRRVFTSEMSNKMLEAVRWDV